MNYYNDKPDGYTIFCWAVFIIALLLCIARPIDKANNMRDVTVTVTDKTVKNDNDSSKYLIFTEDDNGDIHTFEITDSMIKGRFDSSDTYAAIKVGKTYKFTVGGTRNELMSWYPNIYEYELVKD